MLSNEQIKHMVDRFLNWRLPKPWNPDNGISYQRPNYAHPPADHDWPTGTNLFGADEATAMVRHMIEGVPGRYEIAWLIEWPAATADLPVRWWHLKNGWTIDANRATRFSRKEDAEAFIENCGPGGHPMKWAIATEHMWS